MGRITKNKITYCLNKAEANSSKELIEMQRQISYLGCSAMLVSSVVACIRRQQWLLVLLGCVSMLPFVSPR